MQHSNGDSDGHSTGNERQALLQCLVEAALECRDLGQTVDLHEICAEHPSLVPQVAEALGIDSALADMHQATQDIDPLIGVTFNERYRLDQSLGRGAMGGLPGS